MNDSNAGQAGMPTEDLSLLIVDDDVPFLNRLGRAMESRGFDVATAPSVEEALNIVAANWANRRPNRVQLQIVPITLVQNPERAFSSADCAS